MHALTALCSLELAVQIHGDESVQAAVGQMTRLTRLDLEGTAFWDTDVAEDLTTMLQPLTGLQELRLMEVRITNAPMSSMMTRHRRLTA